MKKNLLGISLITMSCLYGLLAAIIILIFIITGLPAIGGIIISGIVLLIQFLISPYLTDLTLKWFYKADFNAEVPEYLKNFINEVCKKYDMKYPKIAIIEDGAPNAFTYGRTKNDARVVVTRGIFNLLNEQEVIAVVAHELGHAEHYDMAFMTVAQLVPLVLYGIYEAFTRPSKNRSNNKNGGYLEMIGLIAYILYLISEYIVLWLSRTREYYADSFSIEETKNPNALETALIKIGYGLSINNSEQDTGKKKKHTISNSKIIGIFDTKTSKSLVATSYNNGQISTENIKNAMKWETWNVWAILYELKSTHPLISKRLKAIGERCAEFNQQPFVTFDLKKPESYLDDFIIEVIINYLPIISIIITMIATLIIAPIEPYNVYALKILGIGGIITLILSLIKMRRRYKNNIGYKETTVSDLLGEVKVSGVTSIPCTLEGTIIGRGNPGCIFNEDFVIKDETGIMFLDYNQPLTVVNKIFALFKSPEYFNKKIKIKGWYRRSPVPYVEIYTMEIDGKTKKCYTYATALITRIVLIVMSILLCLL